MDISQLHMNYINLFTYESTHNYFISVDLTYPYVRVLLCVFLKLFLFLQRTSLNDQIVYIILENWGPICNGNINNVIEIICSILQYRCAIWNRIGVPPPPPFDQYPISRHHPPANNPNKKNGANYLMES